jgi:hypothetical protein
VGDAPEVGLLFAVSLSAAERTPQTAPFRIARISEKEDAAMPASLSASAELRIGFKNRSKTPIIDSHQAGYGWGAVVPVRRKFKMFFDLDCKKPKLSLKMDNVG